MPDSAELHAYLRLMALSARPARNLRQIAAEGGCEQALENPGYQIKTETDPRKIAAARQLADRQIAWLQDNKVLSLHIGDSNYPPSLKESPDPPAWLFVQGNPNVLILPSLAVVGSRQATALSGELAGSISQAYSHTGGCVVSGLAKGIDTAAHRGALQVAGATVAVFGCGLDKPYPSQNTRLVAEIFRAKGACVSEYPPMTGPKRHQFPERNRIIAGLCEGVVVVEAAAKSGALITARFAMEAGREVFAIPGNIWNNRHQGCHFLLKQGAKLVQEFQDIAEELPSLKHGFNALQQSVPTQPERSAFEMTLIKALTHEPQSAGQLAASCKAGISKIASTLTMLELEGIIARQASGYRLTAHTKIAPSHQKNLN